LFIGHNWDNEKDLVEGCIKNDRQAQEFLFRNYAPKMMGVCLRYAKSKEDR
jgi:RNA polymerase sigma-70 factor (ECF subfamily)